MSPKIKYFLLNKFDNDIFDFLQNTHGIFQLIDAKTLVSEVQVLEAIRKTDRYISHNEKIRFPGTVLLMYLAKTNQIDVALKRCGIDENTERGVVIYSNFKDINSLVDMNYIKITEKFLPYDMPEYDFDVFSGMAKVDLTF
jgi:tRNA threonylcarbamoyladenosine modification (KEOPS) complex Cgi121 subunit